MKKHTTRREFIKNGMVLAAGGLLLPAHLMSKKSYAGKLIGSGKKGGAACTTSNHEQIVDETGTSAGSTGVAWVAGKFTLASSSDVTRYIITMLDGSGIGTGDLRISLYTNNATPDPDEPGSEISGTVVTIDMSTVPTTLADVTIDLSATYEGLTAGDYWLVTAEEGGADRDASRKTEVGGERAYSTDGSTWTTVADSNHRFEIYGCPQ